MILINRMSEMNGGFTVSSIGPFNTIYKANVDVARGLVGLDLNGAEKDDARKVVDMTRDYVDATYKTYDGLVCFIQDGMGSANQKNHGATKETILSGPMADARRMPKALEPERKRLVV